MRTSPLCVSSTVFLLLAVAGCEVHEGDGFGTDLGTADIGGTTTDTDGGGEGTGTNGDDGADGAEDPTGGDTGDSTGEGGDSNTDDGNTDDGNTGDGDTDDGNTDDGDTDTGDTGDGDTDDGDTDTDTGDTGTDDGDDGGSGGCGMDHDTGTIMMTAMIGGVSRQYVLVVPSGYDSNRAYPLVFGMHGLGGNGPLLRQYMSIESLTAGGAIHIYPSASGSSWDLSQAGVDMQFFDAMVEYAEGNLCIDSDRIFSYGHSYGGFYSNALACYRGDVLRAIGPVSGGGPNAFGGCQGQVAAILMHGTDDMTVNISSGEGSRDHWVSANNCDSTTQDIEPSPCIEYDGCDSGYPVVWCEHSGINHNVPWSGTLNYGPQALWDFFQRF